LYICRWALIDSDFYKSYSWSTSQSDLIRLNAINTVSVFTFQFYILSLQIAISSIHFLSNCISRSIVSSKKAFSC